MFKWKIKTKIVLIFLSLPIATILVFNSLYFYAMHKLGDTSTENISLLGETAATDSANALRQYASTYLLRTAENQAAISNARFKKVEAAANLLAWYASDIWNYPQKIIPKPSYEWNQKPKSGKALTVLRIAPGASRKKLKYEIDMSSNLDGLFQTSLENDSNIKSIYIGTKSGFHRRAPFTSKRKKTYDPRKRSWYKQAVKSGKLGWTDLYISASEEILMVTCYKPVYDKAKKLIGVIGLDVTLSSLNKKIINTRIGNNGYAMLLDQKGEVVAHPKLLKGDQKWNESFKTENWLNSNNPQIKKIAQYMTMGGIGVESCRYENEDKYIAWAPIETTKWSIGVVMPVEEIIKPAMQTKSKIILLRDQTEESIKDQLMTMRWYSIYFLMGAVLIIFVVAIMLSNTITRPLLSLNEGVRIIGGGNLDHRLEIKTGDEIEDLAVAFNGMADDLKIYINNLQETMAAKERIESELQIAKEIQESMLPREFPPFPEREEFDIFATMEAAREVGGDFYDFFFIEKNKLCFLIGDVSGKGVSAALFMVESKILLKILAMQNIQPAEILFRVNNLLCQQNDKCMFVTVFCAILNTETGELGYANGGHNLPLISSNKEKYEFLELESSPILGARENMKYKTEKLKLKPDDTVFIYTDGVTEAMNPSYELFDDFRLQSALSDLKDKALSEIIAGIRKKIHAFAQGTPQTDDITMLALKFNGHNLIK
jgi:sigma-B regulation protein RsbU (phosphoserine phosphatase)